MSQSRELIPDNIWQKPPRAELAPDQTDEASLLSYAVLDPIVQSHIEDQVCEYDEFTDWVAEMASIGERVSSEPSFLLNWIGRKDARASYQRIISLIGKMEYKRRQTCPGTKVSKVAFGIGRRLPIVEKWS